MKQIQEFLSYNIFTFGNYNFTASTKVGNQKYTKTGIFIVKENLMEQLNRVADHNMLYKLSIASGAKMFTKDSINALFNAVENNENLVAINYLQKSLKDLIDLKIALLILIFVLALEWFLRKFWGLI